MTIGQLIYELLHLHPLSPNASDYKPLGQIEVVHGIGEADVTSITLTKSNIGKPVLLIR